MHHNRLSPVRKGTMPDTDTSSESETEENEVEDGANSSESEDDINGRRYPLRTRPQRRLSGTIPWGAIDL